MKDFVANRAIQFLRSTLLAASFLVVGTGIQVAAQDPGPPPPASGGPRGGMMMHSPAEMRGDFGEGKTVTGIPLTAQVVVTRENTLADGNHIYKQSQMTVYRDSQGRVRREMVLDIATPSTGGVKHTMIMIKDPVSGKRYMLDPSNRTAREMPAGPKGKGPHPEGPGGPPPKGMEGTDSLQKEQLGTKTLAGVQAEGVRVTRTIPAGEIGNEKPIIVTTERWFSSDLQIPVLITHSDPMMGTVTTKITSVTRGEPDASFFQVPSDYKIVSGHPGEPFYVPLQP
jgi:hypothetical protein